MISRVNTSWVIPLERPLVGWLASRTSRSGLRRTTSTLHRVRRRLHLRSQLWRVVAIASFVVGCQRGAGKKLVG